MGRWLTVFIFIVRRWSTNYLFFYPYLAQDADFSYEWTLEW